MILYLSTMQLFSKIPGFFLLLAILMTLSQCNQSDTGRKLKDPSKYKEPLINANREAVKTENEQIEDYIRRHNWKMDSTSTGLRYKVTKHGVGAHAQTGMTVKLAYTMTLLTGDTVYTAQNDGPIIFEIGKGQVITGLEEAILLLRVGDRAKIIIPSHLGFGLIGDQKKIPFKATLVYDIEFISMY